MFANDLNVGGSNDSSKLNHDSVEGALNKLFSVNKYENKNKIIIKIKIMYKILLYKPKQSPIILVN